MTGLQMGVACLIGWILMVIVVMAAVVVSGRISEAEREQGIDQ